MKIQENIPLAPYTTFKIGGPARFFCEAKDEKEILEALKFAREKKLPIFVLGGGSNILVSDKGFEGVVIRLCNSKLVIRNSDVSCGAGVLLSKVVNKSAEAGLAGLEWAAGIPGTVGGAIRGNAGAFGSSMADVVENVKVLEISNIQYPISNKNPKSKIQVSNQIQNPKSQLQITNYKLRECQFAYRDSVFKQNPNLLILSVTLKLKKGNREEIGKKVKEILANRKQKQPFDFPSPGSFFKNPIVKDEKVIKQFEVDTGLKAKENENLYQHTGAGIKIPAGYLIDWAGLKGKKIGSAMVSEKHANFIVNTEDATAENVVMLAAIIKTKVRNKFGIQLQEEVQYVGF